MRPKKLVRQCINPSSRGRESINPSFAMCKGRKLFDSLYLSYHKLCGCLWQMCLKLCLLRWIESIESRPFDHAVDFVYTCPFPGTAHCNAFCDPQEWHRMLHRYLQWKDGILGKHYLTPFKVQKNLPFCRRESSDPSPCFHWLGKVALTNAYDLFVV